MAPGNEITVKPWVIGVFTILIGITGAMIKDKVSTATAETTTTTEIQQLKSDYKRLEDGEKEMIRRDEFTQYGKSIQVQLEDIKQLQQDNRSDLRDIKDLISRQK